MNVLFLTLLDFNTFDERNIYSDLLREFIRNGHNVYCISPVEKRFGIQTHFEENGHLLKLKIGNTQKTNIIEKGISTLLIEYQMIFAIKKYFSNIRFDLILYTTPPITLAKAIKYTKKRDGAKTYLMLKDIFPQNAVDLGLMSTKGLKGLIYKCFIKKEKKLYEISDKIGCMSQANVDYILEHNTEISLEKVEICPNCIDIIDKRLSAEERMVMRDKYGIPRDKKVFVYGGNLGKPQDIPFLVRVLKECSAIGNVYFVIAGSGTERNVLKKFISDESASNVILLGQMLKEEFDSMIACCDAGIIVLDHRFTIPNFPSRLLSYMQAGLPVLACTDKSTDIGKVITDGGFGKWCESSDVKAAYKEIEFFCNNDVSDMGRSGFEYLKKHYNVQHAYQIITMAIEG